MQTPLHRIRIPPELVLEFFAIFSRLEYCLKELGFVRPGPGGRAECDWYAFEAWIEDTYRESDIEADDEVHSAIAYLTSEPPMVQMYNDGATTWASVDLPGPTHIAKAFESSRRVRNNLFHGGKHSPHSPPGRDERLVTSSLALFRSCIEHNETVKGVFEG